MATVLSHHIAGSAFTFQSATATAEEGEPPWMGTAPERTVWWRWTPSSTQSVRFKAPANGEGLPLEIFTGSTLDDLTRIAHNDGRTAIPGVEAVVPLEAQSGVTYFIRVSDPRPEIPPHPMLPAPNRNNLNLVVESADTPLPGFIALSTAGGTPLPDGTIDWETYARLIDVDGSVATNSHWTYQFYIGTSLATLQPFIPLDGAAALGLPLVDSGIPNGSELAGSMSAGFASLHSIPSGQSAVVQVRAWNRNYGSTYESARAHGSPFARSELLQVTMGSELTAPATLKDLHDFQITPGLPNFSPGLLRPAGYVFTHRRWELEATPGFTHAIEAQDPDGTWHLLRTIQNLTGKANWLDQRTPLPRSTIYRARVLD